MQKIKSPDIYNCQRHVRLFILVETEIYNISQYFLPDLNIVITFFGYNQFMALSL